MRATGKVHTVVAAAGKQLSHAGKLHGLNEKPTDE